MRAMTLVIMEFEQYVASETAALVGRLLASQSGQCRERLHALRAALEEAERAAENGPDLQRELQDLVARLTEAARAQIAGAEAEAQRDRLECQAGLDEAAAAVRAAAEENARLSAELARGDADTALLRSELETLGRRADAADRELTTVREAHEQAQRESERLQHAQAALEQELAGARSALEQGSADRQHLCAEIDRLRSERQHIERHLATSEEAAVQGAAVLRERDALLQDLDALRRDQAHLQQQLAETEAVRSEHGQLAQEVTRLRDGHTVLEADLRAALAALQEREALAGELAASRARLQQLEGDAARLQEERTRLQSQLAEATRRQAGGASGAAGERDAEQLEAVRWDLERMVALFDSAVRGVNEMAGARSSTDLLSELVKRLSIQFSRVALFRVKGQSIAGELQIGFDDIDVTTLVLPLSANSVLTRAVNSGAVESVTGPDIAARLATPFSGAPSSAVALPIMLQGTPIAVVYADDADVPEYARGPAVHESSVGFARLLVGEAGVLLMCHTHELKTLAELRQYAATLLQEAKEMYLADAQAGRPESQLRARLKDNLECASQLYTYRAAMEGTAAAALLDEQIAEAIGDSSQFARDLAEVVRSMAGSDLGITAEAT